MRLFKHLIPIALLGLVATVQADAPAWSAASLEKTLQAMPAGDAMRGQRVHEQYFCASCHGTHGESVSRNWPNLAAQRAPYVYKMMLDYRDGRRHEDERAEIMVVLVNMLSEQEMADVAAFYAESGEQERAPLRRDHPADALVRKGDPKRLLTACASCHGVDGQGGRNETPALAGQPREYLHRTMLLFRDGRRDNDAHAGMAQFAWDLSDAEIAAVADYYSATE